MMASPPAARSPLGAGRLGSDRRSSTRCALVALALCALAMSVTACGVPYDASPQSVTEALPSQLTRTSVPPPETTLPLANGYPATFFFVEDGLLVGFPRKIAYPPKLLEILQVLERGPLETIQDGRVIGTDIPPNSALLGLSIVKSVARVGLDTAYYQLPNTEQEIVELAQIVYTVQATLPQVKSVLFYDGTQPAVVPNGNGEAVPAGAPVDETTYCLEASVGCDQPAHSGHETS